MSGIYIHIPFCKQACHYCDFHFSTSLKKKEQMLFCLKKEMFLRQAEIGKESIETIYFGGGTPSILEVEEINDLIAEIYRLFTVVDNPEITLEANPDDLDKETVDKLSLSKVNRLSIGVQSFFDEDLKMMNRAHNANEALNSLEYARTKFDNISVDLIYGIPNMSDNRWLSNVQKLIDLHIPHISCYALTVEEKTALNKLIQKGTVPAPDEESAHKHFLLLIETLKKNGYIHYELSNFGKEGFFSQNNSAYWKGKTYLGIGPSAHSFDGENRSWNIANNALYIREIEDSKLPLERESLTLADRYNEYIMTGLRTMWGVDREIVKSKFGIDLLNYLDERAEKYLESNLMDRVENKYVVADKGKFLGDGISSDLFWLDLK